jgi:hypothetical protein
MAKVQAHKAATPHTVRKALEEAAKAFMVTCHVDSMTAV